ncbi:MAG TPA: hypothetical protein VEF04_03395, partial [Blastocatellia bacterium]|nr:hypothetical protein [Blastocatellia bacterium]
DLQVMMALAILVLSSLRNVAWFIASSVVWCCSTEGSVTQCVMNCQALREIILTKSRSLLG